MVLKALTDALETQVMDVRLLLFKRNEINLKPKIMKIPIVSLVWSSGFG